ncbi:hypothetical protein [Hymenobacter daecheongensis]|uniref:hypothetical protein n=1 Tax=Hymenobacter daecheongensis TaxID=496053 RepID=UPI000933D9D6|nr:hypothetical protein [Hymenobacter daecheongensis]
MLPARAQQPAPDTSSYKFSADIGKLLLSGTPGANQFAAWEYSYIGQYQAALEAWDTPRQPLRKLPTADSAAFAALHGVPAHSYILGRARTARIVIINEAHHNPRHRAFTASLLPDLAGLGFRYFAVEGLNEQDSVLNQRGYPMLQSGFYTKEPQFSNLLRLAARTRYQLVPYDYGFSHAGDAGARVEGREMAQARNIQRILQADPQAKIVVHCGFSHLNEGPNGLGGQPAMARRLRELTGIDPLTIDQTELSESGTRGGENARYRLARAAGSAVLLDDRQQPFTATGNDMTVDLMVFHPRTTYRAGRPTWVFGAGRRPVAVAGRVTVGFPCLVLAYAAGEALAQAIPVDVVELQRARPPQQLALAPGKYTIVAKDQVGNQQTWPLNL